MTRKAFPTPTTDSLLAQSSFKLGLAQQLLAAGWTSKKYGWMNGRSLGDVLDVVSWVDYGWAAK